MRFEVVHTVWGADDEVFGGGVHEVAKPTVAFLRLLAGGEAAGAVVILDSSDTDRAKLDRHVQSQEDGEAAYDKALTAGIAAREAAYQAAYDAALEKHSDDTIARAVANEAVQLDTSWAADTWHEGNYEQFALDVAAGVRQEEL